MNAENSICKMRSPLWAMVGQNKCWKCGRIENVVALAAEEFEREMNGELDPYGGGGFATLSNITLLPDEILLLLQKLNPLFQKRLSKTMEAEYYANGCSCGALFGDFYLHDEPGHTFFPQSQEAASAIKLYQLPINGEWLTDCSSSARPDDLISEHGIRCRWV